MGLFLCMSTISGAVHCLSKANLFNFMDKVEISVSAEPGIVEKTA